MFLSNIKWLLLVIFLLTQLNANYLVFAENGPQPPASIASTNASTVQMGSAFTMKCELPANYTIGNNFFQMFFKLENGSWFLFYYFNPSTSGHKERKFEKDLSNSGVKPYIASVMPVSNPIPTSNTFEVTVTTTKVAYSTRFFCQSYDNGLNSDDSNYVAVTVTSSPPPTLTSNVSHVRLNQPFTLTCSLPSDFSFNNTAYQVAFFNNRNGLLADYEIDVSGNAFLVSKEFANVTAHLGRRKTFPTFDLVIKEMSDRKLSYWCELLTVDSTTQKYNFSLESGHWKPAGPFVDFSSTVTESEHRARCSIDELANFSDKEYKVAFYSDFGQVTGVDTLLGYFWMRPHDVTEFVTETIPHWTTIVHGTNVKYPNFEIVGKLESGVSVSNHKWWCALNFTEPGQSQPRQIKSNLEAL